MPRSKKIPPIPFEFKDAVSRLLRVKPASPKKPANHPLSAKSSIAATIDSFGWQHNIDIPLISPEPDGKSRH
jgi:hypothetical protein